MIDFLDSLSARMDSATAGSGTLVVLASALVPMVAAAAAWMWRMPDRNLAGAIALGVTWNAAALLALNSVAERVGWWSFSNAGPELGATPIVLWLGWIALWGVLAALATCRIDFTMAALAAFDLLVMPLMRDIVVLGESWLIGEVVALGAVALPGLLLVRWSAERSHLSARAYLQVILFSLLLFWVIPLITVASVDRTLQLDVPLWALGFVLVAVAAASLPAITAVVEFHTHGGTPWPWDHTDKPVRSGPYRYVRSPMQTGGVLILMAMSCLYREPLVMVAALSSVLYSTTFCRLETQELRERFGSTWTDLALHQRRWVPTWRPAPGAEPATVWINFGCDVCKPIADFLVRHNPQGLTVRSAADHPEPLRRLRYERTDGASFDGVAAVGASLEHIHFGWAMAGWTLRLPVLWRLWQLIGDAVGFEQRLAEPAGQRPRTMQGCARAEARNGVGAATMGKPLRTARPIRQRHEEPHERHF